MLRPGEKRKPEVELYIMAVAGLVYHCRTEQRKTKIPSDRRREAPTSLADTQWKERSAKIRLDGGGVRTKGPIHSEAQHTIPNLLPFALPFFNLHHHRSPQRQHHNITAIAGLFLEPSLLDYYLIL